MEPVKSLPRQQRGKNHDQQRPEIGNQACLRRRGIFKGQEVKEMIAEQPRNAEQPESARNAEKRTDILTI
jgi:hypothetical protein